MDRSLVSYRSFRTCALDKNERRSAHDSISRTNSCTKNCLYVCFHVEITAISMGWCTEVTFGGSGITTTCLQMSYKLECELALSTNKATFSEVQERMWRKNTELDHFLNVSDLDQAV